MMDTTEPARTLIFCEKKICFTLRRTSKPATPLWYKRKRVVGLRWDFHLNWTSKAIYCLINSLCSKRMSQFSLRRDYSHIFVNFGEISQNFNFTLKTLLNL